MHHQHHRPMQRSALSATFDFWYAPSTSSSTSEGSTAAATDGLSSTSSPQQQQQQPLLPAPHAQLLFDDEHPSFVELKGQDHRLPGHEEHDDESESDDDDDDDMDMMLMMEVEAATTTTLQGPPLPHIFGERSSSSSWRGGGACAGGGARRQTMDPPRRPSWLSLGFARPRSESALLTMKSSTSPAATNEAKGENKLKRVHDESIIHSLPPGLVRVPSGSSLDEDCSSSTSSNSSSNSSDDSSCSASPSTSSTTASQKSRPKGVSFSLTVQVQPIPHSSLLSHSQRLRMYTSSDEVRKNKIRNKMEYRHDGYDWRNVSEEWEMGVDMVTGELVHPVHEMQHVHHHHHHQRL
jgi:hypothetical protein